MANPSPRVQIVGAEEFRTVTSGVQTVYTGPVRVHQIIKLKGSAQVIVYNGSTSDPEKRNYTPSAALVNPHVLLGPVDCGVIWDKGITVNNVGAEELAIIYSPIV